jgi:PAS domain S-box-containing protein
MRETRPELRILHVEDDPQDALLVEHTLRKEGLTFRVTRLETEEEFVRALQGSSPDLILSDFAMPGFSGAVALSRAQASCPEVPFIFVSGHIGEDRAIESLKNGATDYVLKDRLSRLGPVVRRALTESEDRRKRREAEALLSDRRAEADLVLEHTLDAVITISTEGRVTGWNSQAERTFGWAREEVLGRPLEEFFFPPAARGFATSENGPVLDRRIELPALHKKGFELPVEMTVTRITAPGRTFFAAFVKDMREIKREAAALAVDYSVTKILADAPTLDAAIPGLLRVMTECLSWDLAQFWKFDAEAEVLRATHSWPPLEEKNSEFVRASRLIALKIGAGLPGEVWRTGEGIWAPDISAGEVYARAGYARKEGLRGAFGFPIVDGQELLGVIECFHRDVRPPDAELLEMMTQVGSALGQFYRRTLDAQDLSGSNDPAADEREKPLRDGAEELDTFAAGIAHDLRAPLRALVGFSEILTREWSTLPEDEVEVYLDRIRSAAAGMDTVLENLLGYVRLSRERIALVPVDLGWEVEDVLRRMEPEFRERDAEVRVEPPLPRALAHPRSLRQALFHLISNALKFVAPGVPPRIQIEAEDRGDRIRLSIADNGIGIPRDQHDRIFNVFERLHSISEYPGTGIGLAIVRRGMERMGGSTGVESSPGQGSTFWIELPKETALA